MKYRIIGNNSVDFLNIVLMRMRKKALCNGPGWDGFGGILCQGWGDFLRPHGRRALLAKIFHVRTNDRLV